MINNEWFPTPDSIAAKMYAKIANRLTHRSRVQQYQNANVYRVPYKYGLSTLS